MNILAINTAFSQSYVAVKTKSKVVLNNMDSSLKQSENILGLIDNSLTSAQTEISQIDTLACVIGPGSFTGIRIGASLAKGITSAIKHIKKVQICSLDLVAYTFAKNAINNDFWVVLNALSGNLFACKYNKDAKRIGQPIMVFESQLETIAGIVVGLDEEQLEICNYNVSLSSEDLLAFTEQEVSLGNFCDDFVPMYIRKSQAEENI